MFFLAPEFQDHGIVTEKVCLYANHSGFIHINVRFYTISCGSSLGVCVRGGSHPLDYGKVSFISQSKAGHAEKTQETSAGDGQKNSSGTTVY